MSKEEKEEDIRKEFDELIKKYFESFKRTLNEISEKTLAEIDKRIEIMKKPWPRGFVNYVYDIVVAYQSGQISKWRALKELRLVRRTLMTVLKRARKQIEKKEE